ncbi:uncharacterized protein LOC133044331 [Dama dama]|uniref:uncharacterized protein LOC133044331 n=1 Tax=Dama dama TaxID=30532 RepID=UPI002A3632D9|nr:uncharacterized protein LOC133044331 [Dama dama]
MEGPETHAEFWRKQAIPEHLYFSKNFKDTGSLPPGHLISAAPSAWNAFLPKSLWTAIHPTLSSVSTPTSPHQKVFSKRPRTPARSPFALPAPPSAPPSFVSSTERKVPESKGSCLSTAGSRCCLRPRGDIEGSCSEPRGWCLHSSPGQEEKENVLRARMFLKMLFARAGSRAICRHRSARVPVKNSGGPPLCPLRPTRINTADGGRVKEESHSAIFSFPLKSYISRFKFVFRVLFQPK